MAYLIIDSVIRKEVNHKENIQNVKPRSEYLAPSADLIYGLFENGDNKLSEQFLRWKLWKKWSFYVGENISKICEPVAYFQGRLYIFVRNSSWMQQLVFLKDTLQTNLNEKIGFNYVNRIILTMDPKDIPRNESEITQLHQNIDRISKY